MERLDKKNRGSDGTKPLVHFMDPGDKEPSAMSVESFFQANYAVIRSSVFPNVEERESYREELKDHFQNLLIRPLHNSLYGTFIKWRKQSPNCQFGVLLKAVKMEHETDIVNDLNVYSMKDWKQKIEKTRYEEKFFKPPTNKVEQKNAWRVDVVGNYVASLKKELRSFLGASNYFRRFILNYAKIAAPLTKLLSEKVDFVWTQEQEETFKLLKRKLKEAPILAPPDLNRNFVIHTDASEYAIGGVLLQEDEENKQLRLITCVSRVLNSVEKRWQIVEKEALALVFAIKSFRYYIEGKTTDVFTDQRALVAIKNAKRKSNQTTKIPTNTDGI